MNAHRPAARLARLGALAQALLFAASLVAAPLLHEWTCNGACARTSSAAALAPAPCGPAPHGVPPCHAAGAAHSKKHGCQCTDDCCALWAQFVSPPAVADDAPSERATCAALAAIPDESGRAPAARLLPFPTGPPPAA